MHACGNFPPEKNIGTMEMQGNFFKGLQVIEFSSVLAGPAVGMFFAELGAHVIKIENKKAGGDLTRHWKQAGEPNSAPASSYYYSVNYHKEIIFLDLSSEDDQRKAQTLVASADLIITNFKEGDDVKFGVVPAELAGKYPALIIAEIKGFEDSGRVAYDAVLQAESGFMSMNGNSASGPVKMPVALIDLLAAHQLKEGILLALLHKATSGKGAIISVSLYQAAIASLANQASNWLNNGLVPGLQGSLHPNIAPYGERIRTGDDQSILLAIGTDEQFFRLCAALGDPGLASHTQFQTNALRIQHRTLLLEELNKRSIRFSAKDLMSIFIERQIPAGQIKSLDEVFENPIAKKMILSQDEPDGTISKRVQTTAFKIYFS